MRVWLTALPYVGYQCLREYRSQVIGRGDLESIAAKRYVRYASNSNREHVAIYASAVAWEDDT